MAGDVVLWLGGWGHERGWRCVRIEPWEKSGRGETWPHGPEAGKESRRTNPLYILTLQGVVKRKRYCRQSGEKKGTAMADLTTRKGEFRNGGIVPLEASKVCKGGPRAEKPAGGLVRGREVQGSGAECPINQYVGKDCAGVLLG